MDKKLELLARENESLKEKLKDLEDTLSAIRTGEVDALVVSSDEGDRIYSISTAETTYRMLIEQMNEGASTLSNDGIVLYCNERFSGLLNIPIENLIGERFETILDNDHREKFRELFIEGKEKNVRSDFSFPIDKGADGKFRHLLFSLTPFRDEPDHKSPGSPGSSTKVSLIINDITYLKSIEEQLLGQKADLEKMVAARTGELEEYRDHLEDMVEQRTQELNDAQQELILKERLATLGQVSGSISHELRNPLGVIDSSLYYLNMKLDITDEKIKKHLKRIKSSVDNMTSIIQSLLNLTHMRKPVQQKGDLVTITSECIKFCDIPDNIDVKKDFPDEEIPISVDNVQFEIVIRNIIKNAVDAMEGRGTLTITIKKPEENQAVLSIIDTGPGIKQDDLEKIFKPLYSTKAKGVGFGLSIAKMIVENHEGTLEVNSEYSEGAAFKITLPEYTGNMKEA